MSKTANLFVIDLHYVAPLDVIDGLMKRHVAYLNRGYAEGLFLASGRKVPRTGGIILATGTTRAALEERMAADPFVSEGAATFTVTEFRPSQTAATFK